jgi:hypothetical protein
MALFDRKLYIPVKTTLLTIKFYGGDMLCAHQFQ